MTLSEDLKQEQQRQVQIMAEAITEAIEKTGLQFQTPMLNAVAGALVSVEASVLASLPDRKTRKALQDTMNRARPKAREAALASSGYKPKVRVVTFNRKSGDVDD